MDEGNYDGLYVHANSGWLKALKLRKYDQRPAVVEEIGTGHGLEMVLRIQEGGHVSLPFKKPEVINSIQRDLGAKSPQELIGRGVTVLITDSGRVDGFITIND